MLLVSLLGLLLSSSLLSLDPSASWKVLSFDGVPANEISYSQETMKIAVEESASPMVHLFSEPIPVQSIEAIGLVQGHLNIPPSASWTEIGDDALLRIGIIEKGDKRLNPLQKLTAPSWIREIQDGLGDDDYGVGAIHCFHLMPSSDWVGQSRTNPASALFREEIVSSPTKEGKFVLRGSMESPIEACGIWVLADGDDTESTFTISLESISISSPERE